MVRLIYFLPINRTAQPDINAKLDTLIKDVQQFYAEQMHAHGFGRKTFSFETDATGKAVVHHVNGEFTDRYYNHGTFDKVTEEIEEQFNLSTNLYLISIDTGSEKIDVQWCGRGGIHGTTGGKAVVPASGNCFVGDHGLETAAHELGHAFGLDHDFRDDAYMMSYGTERDQLSYCAAKWLDTHGYFNNHQTAFNEPTTMTMHTPIALPTNVTRLRFEVRDTDGLHQAQLIIPTDTSDPADGVKLHSCKALSGEIEHVEFTIGSTHAVTLRVMDVNGNFTQETYPVTPSDVAHIDVNMDGIIDVADLVRVASDFGTTADRAAIRSSDVNNDGFVNREDLLLVVEVLESDESIPMESTSSTTLSLAPTVVSSPAIGEQFTLSLNITGGENVAGYQVTVLFDTSALRYVSSENGGYLPQGEFFVTPIVDENKAMLAATSLSGESSGSGTFVTLTFEVVAIKVSTVRLTNVLLTDGSGGSSVPRIENAEITEPPQLPEDVNRDGIVNIIDLTLVASSFGVTGQNASDINGDGVVNIIDLTLVAAAFGNAAAAPAIWSLQFESAPTRAQVEQWLNQARRLNLTDSTFQRGIGVLEQLLAALTPKTTALLPNYPNPFNPETWIPYQLANSADVKINIYDAQGAVVRVLTIGHQTAGYYTSRSRAAYWDG
ncbi:MAG: dockerin type I domain-containing protein, partial [Proteobacteria bacterium]|nr:dockerin type I domain-containing protein [Pseudomonadota bacterium]